ncbi:MAG: hypothetical protein ACOCYZ_05410, partial [Halococcoides sp.]
MASQSAREANGGQRAENRSTPRRERPTRRQFLGIAGASATLAIAGCADDGDPTTTETPTAELTNPSFEDDLEGWTIE